MYPELQKGRNVTGQELVAHWTRRGRAIWASFRRLPLSWQATFVVLLLLLVVAGRGGEPAQVQTRGASAATQSSASDTEADETIDDLRSQVSDLREEVAMAEARAERAETAQESAASITARLSAQRSRIATLNAKNASLRQRLVDSQTKVAKATDKAAGLRAELASVSASVAAPPEQVTVEEPAADEGCHPSYSGCVPITSDVDCAGGSGDGPEYTDFVEVTGPDEYDLDSDGDGTACES